MMPSCKSQWEALKNHFPEYNFTVVMQKPGMFLFDDSGDESDFSSSSVKYVFVEEDAAAKDFARVIAAEKPDVAVAVTYWTQPFDWMSIKDGMIKEELEAAGIKTVCHSPKTAEICFDKWKTHQFLEQNGFLCAKGVYVHHEMFYAERNRNVIQSNIYKEYVFSEIKKLNFPVVIKDTLGLSSFGMDVVHTFEEARHVLLSKKNNGDRIVEEFLSGDSFGIEVYGCKGNYTVALPLINSVNQYGLTSPKQNVKLGPAGIDEKSYSAFKIKELQAEILRLAEAMDFSGIAQIDLLFSGGRWYIIEINSRLSGMSQTMAASMNLSLYELILFSAGIIEWKENYKFVMNLKFPLLKPEQLDELSEKKYVMAVNQIENREAKQLREVGYTEIIFGGDEKLDDTMCKLDELNGQFSEVMEPVFFKNARLLADTIGWHL